MKKILFLPLLQMQSGHHQVAEALMDMLKDDSNEVILKKIDLLSYTNKSLEKVITNSYLNWIRYAPESYNLAYKSFFYAAPSKEHSFTLYQHMFLKKMEQLLAAEKPDLLICTHGFPSLLVSKLKMKGKCHIPVINVYTDFFINSLWGKEAIDVHFLPSQLVKEKLSRKYHIPNERLFVTGIPIHETITKDVYSKKRNDRPKILLSGGNSGLGGILKLADELKRSTHVDYLVLCGNNKKLYDEILSWQLEHIKPLPYLSSRSEMNKLYEEVDAIVTKPGGVTISEAMRKRVPIFVHSVLPGQEKINLQYLKEQELVFELNQKIPFEKQLLSLLTDQRKMNGWVQAVNEYQQGIELDSPKKMAGVINAILGQETKGIPAGVVNQSKNYRMAGA